MNRFEELFWSRYPRTGEREKRVHGSMSTRQSESDSIVAKSFYVNSLRYTFGLVEIWWRRNCACQLI